MHYAAAVRTREFGVRFALGATPARVLSMVIRDGVTVALIRAVAGTTGAIAAARTFQALLFGVPPWDLNASLHGSSFLAAAAPLAPATRAARLNPADALRGE